MAAEHVDRWEILDYASDQKPDVPSGTSRELAETLGAVRTPVTSVESRICTDRSRPGGRTSLAPESTQCACPATSSTPRSSSPPPGRGSPSVMIPVSAQTRMSPGPSSPSAPFNDDRPHPRPGLAPALNDCMPLWGSRATLLQCWPRPREVLMAECGQVPGRCGASSAELGSAARSGRTAGRRAGGRRRPVLVGYRSLFVLGAILTEVAPTGTSYESATDYVRAFMTIGAFVASMVAIFGPRFHRSTPRYGRVGMIRACWPSSATESWPWWSRPAWQRATPPPSSRYASPVQSRC